MNPKVFISYCHRGENGAYPDKVWGLQALLMGQGIYAIIDQDQESSDEIGQGWSAWQENAIDEADFCLIVCDETYRAALKNDGGDNPLTSVQKEYRYLIDIKKEKSILVAAFDGEKESPPPDLSGQHIYNISKKSSIKALIKRLTGGKKYQPLEPHPQRNFAHDNGELGDERGEDGEDGEDGCLVEGVGHIPKGAHCKHAISFWDTFLEEGKVLEPQKESESNLIYLVMTLESHGTDNFSKARQLGETLKLDEGDVDELALWSTMGSSEFILKCRLKRRETINKIVSRLRDLKLSKPQYYKKPFDYLAVADEYVLSDGQLKQVYMPTAKGYPANSSIKVFIEFYTEEGWDFNGVISVLKCHSDIVTGFAKDAASTRMMVELLLPCGWFTHLCELTKELDQVEGEFTKQTFIGYHDEADWIKC